MLKHSNTLLRLPRELKRQNGFILLPVVMAITLVAAVAFLMNREGAMAVNQLGGEMQASQAKLAAKAGINQILWQANKANCTGYANLTSTTIGTNSYSATISPTSGSPISVTATGTTSNGTSYSLKRNQIAMYQPYNSVTLQLGTDSGKDASVYNIQSNTNFGGTDNAVSNIWALLWFYKNQLIQFDLPNSIPPAAHIVSAQLQLYQTSGINAGNMSVHRVTRDWLEGTQNGSGTADGTTWKTYDGTNSWTNPGGDYDATAISSGTVNNKVGGITSFEIAPLVQAWLSGTSPNNGLLLKADDYITATFASKEDATPANRPKLIITYTCECGKVCSPAKKIYWTDDSANKIQMADEDGSHLEDIITILDRPTGLDIDPVNGKLYWTNNTQIMRSNLDGTNRETLYSALLVTLDIKLDVAGGKMYWTHDNGTSLIMRANLDGSNPQIINVSLNRPAYLSLNPTAGHIYLTNFGNGAVSRMNLDGTNITNLASSQGGAVGSAVDPIKGKLYWSAGAAGNWIRRSNLDGSTIETIVTGLTAPQDITYDADNNRIYWTEGTGKKVQRANPDGSNMVTLVSTGLARPRGIALVNASLVGKGRTMTLNPVADTYLYEGSTGTNYGTGLTLYNGRSASGKQYKGLIKFDVSTLPAGATVTSATLRLNETTSTGSGFYNIGVYKIKATWSETTATWSNFSASTNYDATQLAVTSVAAVTAGFKDWTLSPALINEWKDSVPTPNYGLALVYESTANGTYFQFATKENATVGFRPQLIINYTLP